MAVFDEKLQNAKASITERGIFMFNNELLSDVSLVVRASSDHEEPKKSKMAIPAHKFVLLSCSSVFFAMFCGKMAEKSDSVDLPDCEYEGVLEMLRYMYSGKAELNKNNVMEVLYVAKKYILPCLVKECIKFLQENLNTENVFYVLSHAQQYDEKILVDQCWELIDRETEETVQSERFLTIERSLLEEIVKRDTLTITEVELFKAVDLWAARECERQGLTPDGSVKRRILKETIVKEIRFPVMEEKEFASVVLGSEILTSKEGLDIIKYFNGVVGSPVGFIEQRRIGTSLLCYRFSHVVNSFFDNFCAGWDYSTDRKECIDLKVDKDIQLYGLRMCGSKNEDYVVMLRVIDTEDDIVLASKSGRFSSVHLQNQPLATPDFYGFDILFDSPAELKKNIKYCISAIIDGPDSCFGINGLCDVQCHGVHFAFFKCTDCEDESSMEVKYLRRQGRKRRENLGTRSGQFAALLFRPQ